MAMWSPLKFSIEQTCGRPKETVQIENAESDLDEDELFPLVLEYVGNLGGEELQRMRMFLPDKALCEEDTTGSS